jgi:hypothetical protein
MWYNEHIRDLLPVKTLALKTIRLYSPVMGGSDHILVNVVFFFMLLLNKLNLKKGCCVLEIEKFLNENKKDSELMWQFAFLGRNEQRQAKLEELSSLAESENWTSSESSWTLDILYSYLTHTFDRAAHEDLVLISDNEDYACFNTGLLTENGEDIICMFNRFTSSDEYFWHIMGFRKNSDWEFMNNFSKTPDVVSYFSDPSKIYFNPKFELIKKLDHILDDNLDRFPEDLKNKGAKYINALLTHALDLTVKRCERNYRIAVPQYYKGKITYLLPVELDGHLMSLAVEDVNGKYRVNTIFTIEMAYKNARLLMKPEADWLTPATKKEVE